MTVIAGHQPNFLPYSGYWFKLAHADVMDVRHTAQFTEKGYQRRVKMRENWCSLPLVGKPRLEPINEVEIDIPKFQAMFPKLIHGRYSGSRYYKAAGKDVVDYAMSLETPLLWEFNYSLLVFVRDMLGITTPFNLGAPAIGGKAEGVLSTLRTYPEATVYLSGKGARNYMGDTSIFENAGIEVRWVNHKVTTEDSVLSLIMDYSDPMEIIMLEEEEAQ